MSALDAVTRDPAGTLADLYRLHVSTGCSDRGGTFAFCRRGGFLGVGWGMTAEPLDWTAYETVAIHQDGRVNPSVRQLHDLKTGSLIWSRDITRGLYYPAQVTGPWRYLHNAEASRFDIHNVRPVRMLACGVDSAVPGAVISSFIAGRALQRVHDAGAGRYSAALYGTLTGQPLTPSLTLEEILRSCLDAQDLEDLICVYLQRRYGYLAVPGRRQPDTPAYEYVLRHPDGHEAVVQVKRGHAPVLRDAQSLPTEAVDRVYVFSPSGTYGPTPARNVTTLTNEEIIAFMRNERTCLPRNIEHWISQAITPLDQARTR